MVRSSRFGRRCHLSLARRSYIRQPQLPPPNPHRPPQHGEPFDNRFGALSVGGNVPDAVGSLAPRIPEVVQDADGRRGVGSVRCVESAREVWTDLLPRPGDDRCCGPRRGAAVEGFGGSAAAHELSGELLALILRENCRLTSLRSPPGRLRRHQGLLLPRARRSSAQGRSTTSSLATELARSRWRRAGGLQPRCRATTGHLRDLSRSRSRS